MWLRWCTLLVKPSSMQEVSAPQELDQLLPNLHATLAKVSHTTVDGAGTSFFKRTVGAHNGSAMCLAISLHDRHRSDPAQN